MCSRHRDLRSFPTRRSSDLVGVTVTILLAAAMPLAALTGWFAAGAATRSVLLRAWASLAWALGPALLIGIGAGRLGAVVAHIVLPLVILGVVRSLGLDRRDVVVSGMVGAKRLPQRTSRRAGKTAREVKRARLAALARVARHEPEKAAEEPVEPDEEGPEPDEEGAEPDEEGAEPDEDPVEPGEESSDEPPAETPPTKPRGRARAKAAPSGTNWTGMTPTPSTPATPSDPPTDEA